MPQEQLKELDQYKERVTTQSVTISHLEDEKGTLEEQLKEARTKIEELARQMGSMGKVADLDSNRWSPISTNSTNDLR